MLSPNRPLLSGHGTFVKETPHSQAQIHIYIDVLMIPLFRDFVITNTPSGPDNYTPLSKSTQLRRVSGILRIVPHPPKRIKFGWVGGPTPKLLIFANR